jgi:hypothetical protein
MQYIHSKGIIVNIQLQDKESKIWMAYVNQIGIWLPCKKKFGHFW